MSASLLMVVFGRIGRVFKLAAVVMAACWLLATSGTLAFAQEPAEPPERPRILHVIGVDGSGLHALPSEAGKTYGSPDWSPDGEWLAYDVSSINHDVNSSRIEVIRANGEDRREIGPGAMPSWSPDGKQIVAHTYTSEGIVVMDVDGEGRETIMEHWGSPRWSPVGNRVIAANSGAGLSIFDLAAGTEYSVMRNVRVYQGLSIAPDGLRVCFADPQGALMLATFDAEMKHATAKRLVDGGYFSHSSWSPDGKQIAFTWKPDASNEDPSEDPEQLYLLDVDDPAKPPRKMKGLNAADDNADPDWSPDGKQIAFSLKKGRSATE